MRFKRYLKFIGYAALLMALFIFAANLLIYFKSRPFIYDDPTEVPEAQTVLILGAAVYSNGELSPVFESRVNRALELYKAGKVSNFLVSGDNSSIYHNEVNPVKDWLLEEEIPEGDIHLDHAGFDTYSTMYRARDIFHAGSVTIVTQPFHLPRAVFLGRELGIEAYGVKAKEGRDIFFNYTREIFANVKAILNLIFSREPKFLGEPMPIGRL